MPVGFRFPALALAVSVGTPYAMLSAQSSSKPFALTVPNIMRGPELYGIEPTNIRWSADGQWIYLFKPAGDHFISEKLVNMKHHHYKLEPNVHFSPDGKWIIFGANFEGESNIYAVEVKKHE